MAKISWNHGIGNEELLHGVKGEGAVIFTYTKEKANWIGPVLRRNCLLNTLLNERDKGGIRRRNNQLLDDIKDTRRHWKKNH